MAEFEMKKKNSQKIKCSLFRKWEAKKSIIGDAVPHWENPFLKQHLIGTYIKIDQNFFVILPQTVMQQLA